MSYRAHIETEPETVSVMKRASEERLQEARLLLPSEPHSAVYLSGMAAEMLLKTALCMVVGGTALAEVRAYLSPIRHHTRTVLGIHVREEESGHSIFYWYQQLVRERAERGMRQVPNRTPQVIAHLYMNWTVEMRYHPDALDSTTARDFVKYVEWLNFHHGQLRS